MLRHCKGTPKTKSTVDISKLDTAMNEFEHRNNCFALIISGKRMSIYTSPRLLKWIYICHSQKSVLTEIFHPVGTNIPPLNTLQPCLKNILVICINNQHKRSLKPCISYQISTKKSNSHNGEGLLSSGT